MVEPEVPEVIAAVVVVGNPTDELVRFRGFVEANGVTFVGLGSEPPGSPVVLFIADAAVTMLPEVVPTDRELLPVSFVGQDPSLLPELSHLIPAVVGWDRAASRLADAIRFGNDRMFVWARFFQAAEGWSANPSSPLLDADEQVLALSGLGSSLSTARPAEARTVRSYYRASVARSTRNRRIATTLLSGVGVVLLAAIVLASIQAGAAKAAGDRSITQADNATASRISSDALKGAASDPDLPSLLAAKAIGLSRLPSVRNAVDTVAATAVQHTSRALDKVPFSLAVSDDGHMAIGTEGSDTVKLLAPAGRVTRTVRYASKNSTWQPAFVALDPADTTLVIATSAGISLYTAAGSLRHRLVDGTAGFSIHGWAGPQQLLVLGASGAAFLNTRSGKLTPFAGAPAGVTEAAVSEDGTKVVVATEQGIEVFNRQTGGLINQANLVGIRNLAVSDDGETVVAEPQFGATLMRWSAASIVPQTRLIDPDLQSVDLAPLGKGYFVTGWDDGTLSIIAAANSPGVDLEVSHFQAEAAGIFALASTTAGKLVTVGSDRYFRTWNTQDLANFWHTLPSGVATVDSESIGALGSVATSFLPVAIDNQIRYTTDGGIAVGVRDLDEAITVTHIGDTRLTGRFAGVFGRPFLSDDGKWLVEVRLDSADANWTVAVRPISAEAPSWTSAQPTISVKATMPVQTTGTSLGPILAAVGPDGTSVAIASSTNVRVWKGTNTRTTTFGTPSTPIAVALGGAGASVVTANGFLHLPNDTTENLLKLVAKAGQSAGSVEAAAFVGAAVYLLTDTGAIAEIWKGKARTLLAPGLISGTGILRASSDGSLIAAVAPDGVAVIDVATHSIVARWNDVAGIHVDDVAFSKNERSLAMVSNTSQVAIVSLSDAATPAPITAPRALTKAEALQYQLGGIGG